MGAGVTEINGDFGELRIERDIIEAYTVMATKPDESWHYSDKNGHKHRWDNGYPTLVEVEADRFWCEDCRDEHVDTRLECSICGETIEPRHVSDNGPHYIPGPTSYYLNDERITEDEGKRLLEAHSVPAQKRRCYRARVYDERHKMWWEPIITAATLTEAEEKVRTMYPDRPIDYVVLLHNRSDHRGDENAPPD